LLLTANKFNPKLLLTGSKFIHIHTLNYKVYGI